jgi:hypothetical protein
MSELFGGIQKIRRKEKENQKADTEQNEKELTDRKM